MKSCLIKPFPEAIGYLVKIHKPFHELLVREAAAVENTLHYSSGT